MVSSASESVEMVADSTRFNTEGVTTKVKEPGGSIVDTDQINNNSKGRDEAKASPHRLNRNETAVDQGSTPAQESSLSQSISPRAPSGHGAELSPATQQSHGNNTEGVPETDNQVIQPGINDIVLGPAPSKALLETLLKSPDMSKLELCWQAVQDRRFLARLTSGKYQVVYSLQTKIEVIQATVAFMRTRQALDAAKPISPDGLTNTDFEDVDTGSGADDDDTACKKRSQTRAPRTKRSPSSKPVEESNGSPRSKKKAKTTSKDKTCLPRVPILPPGIKLDYSVTKWPQGKLPTPIREKDIIVEKGHQGVSHRPGNRMWTATARPHRREFEACKLVRRIAIVQHIINTLLAKPSQPRFVVIDAESDTEGTYASYEQVFNRTWEVVAYKPPTSKIPETPDGNVNNEWPLSHPNAVALVPLTVVKRPRDIDVLLGRGNGIAHRVGNRMFRQEVWLRRDDYDKAPRNEKSLVASDLVEAFERLPGFPRFLELHGDHWRVAPHDKVVEKACQALRERNWYNTPDRFNSRVTATSPTLKVMMDETKSIRAVQEGSRIAIFWPLDNEYYPATVVDLDERDKVNILYDDGESEWIVLSEHSFKFLDGGAGRDGPLPASGRMSPRKSPNLAKALLSPDEVKPGMFLQVFWPLHNHWCNIKVLERDDDANRVRAEFVDEEEGDEDEIQSMSQWFDLHTTQFRMPPPTSDKPKSKSLQTPRQPTRVSPAPSPKKDIVVDDCGSRTPGKAVPQNPDAVIDRVSVGNWLELFYPLGNEYIRGKVLQKEGTIVRMTFANVNGTVHEESHDLRDTKFRMGTAAAGAKPVEAVAVAEQEPKVQQLGVAAAAASRDDQKQLGVVDVGMALTVYSNNGHRVRGRVIAKPDRVNRPHVVTMTIYNDEGERTGQEESLDLSLHSFAIHKEWMQY